MHRYLLILLLLVCQDVLAQSSKWILGIKASVGFTGRSNKEVSDGVITLSEYKNGLSYGLGFRVGYQPLKFLSINADVEWQHIQDRRVTTFEAYMANEGETYVYTGKYQNTFERIQLPISLHVYPFYTKMSGYIKIGLMPSIITSGNIKIVRRVTKTESTTDSETLKADFDIPENKGLNKDFIFFAGLGMPITKRIFAEVVYQFNKPMNYWEFDSGNTFIGVPIHNIKANQGLMLSVLYRLN